MSSDYPMEALTRMAPTQRGHARGVHRGGPPDQRNPGAICDRSGDLIGYLDDRCVASLRVPAFLLIYVTVQMTALDHTARCGRRAFGIFANNVFL